MGRHGLFAIVFAAAAVSFAPSAAADSETVPLYTGDDLDRMFGPVPEGPTVLVDNTRPEDWRWVEQFIDRQYARVDADRQYDLDRRSHDVAARRVDPAWAGYNEPVSWGLGYPASTWWNSVWGHYPVSGNDGYRTANGANRNPYARATGEMARPAGRPALRRGGHGGGNGPHRAK